MTGHCPHGVPTGEGYECTSCVTTPQPPHGDARRRSAVNDDPRQAYIDGLHQIADFLAEHPEVPLPSLGSYVSGDYLPTLGILAQHPTADDRRDQRTILADIARAMGNAQKSTFHQFAVWRRFGGIVLAAYADRAEVCDRVVTGTREVTTEVPDPEALAAVPKVTVTEVVEDVEWVCGSLLAKAPAGLVSL